ncbi:unnamed protein product [Effrenium voratum]|nr:unnamed protein product [Effrenium voratum]
MDEEMLAGFKRDPPEPMLFGEEYMCEGLANDPEVEEFAELASRECMRGTCVVATLLPWSLPAPNGVLAPEFDSSDVLLSEEEIAQAVAKVNTVLIPCTLELEEEHEQAKRIVPQLTRLEGVCIIAVLLLPKLMQLNRDTNHLILRPGPRVGAKLPQHCQEGLPERQTARYWGKRS